METLAHCLSSGVEVLFTRHVTMRALPETVGILTFNLLTFEALFDYRRVFCFDVENLDNMNTSLSYRLHYDAADIVGFEIGHVCAPLYTTLPLPMMMIEPFTEQRQSATVS